MAGKNIGDLMNEAGITWGFFEGGFDLTARMPTARRAAAGRRQRR